MKWFPTILVLVASVSATATAQTTSPSPVDTRLPALAVGFEAGQLLQAETNEPIQQVWLPSVQVGLGRRFALQWEGLRWSDETRIPGDRAYRAAGIFVSAPIQGTVGADRTTSGVGSNLLYRAGSGRWTGFLGGGANVEVITDKLTARPFPCGPRVPTFVICLRFDQPAPVLRTWRVVPQFIGGAEFGLAGPVRGVATVRVQAQRESIAAAFTLGARVAITTRSHTVSRRPVSPETALGKEVRVVEHDGTSRTGTFVALSASEVVFTRQGQPIALPLERVRSVERVSRGVKKGVLIGLASGVALSLLATCDTSGDDCPNPYAWVPFAMLLEGGIGAAAGAGIGAIVNAAHRQRNQLYFAASPKLVAVTPIFGADHTGARVGLGMALRF